MIILMREKDFLKKKKHLVVPKDYRIADSTDDASGEITKFGNTCSTDGLKPPKDLIRALSSDSIKLDPEKIEKSEKRYFKSEDFLHTIMGIVALQVKSDINIFVVFKNKDFKVFGKRIFKKVKKLFPTEKDVFFLIEDVDDKILYKKISEDTRRELQNDIDKISKKLKKESEESEKKKDKEKKKKKKDKDKKKKKKKKIKFISID